jgi:hypothetical protein
MSKIGQLEKLGEVLRKLGDDPAAYSLTPPARITGVSPLFGIQRIVDIHPELAGKLKKLGMPKGVKNIVAVEGYDPEKNFIKMISDPDGMRWDLENDIMHPRANTVPAKYQDEVSVIDSMVTKNSTPGGRGVAEYYRLWDDDIDNNRLNISTLLTPRNEIRRPINMMNYLIRRPEAENHIRLYEDSSSYLRGVPTTPDEFASMSLEGKIGYLAAQERANHELYLPSKYLNNQSMTPEELYFMTNLQEYDNPKATVMGPQSIGRGRQTYSILQDIDKGAPLSELVEKYSGEVKFKRQGGLINAN